MRVSEQPFVDRQVHETIDQSPESCSVLRVCYDAQSDCECGQHGCKLMESNRRISASIG